MKRRSSSVGFTLVEMVVSLVLMGILAAFIAPLIRGPVDRYVESQERGRLANGADNALRRMARDIRLAVPNSLRMVNGADGRIFLEFLLSTGGGTYRSLPKDTGAGKVLDFGSAVSEFDFLGAPPNAKGASWVVVGNLSATDASQPNAYLPLGDVNASRARCKDGNCSGSPIAIDAATFLPAAEFPSRRFFLVSGPVTYECDPGAGVLRRHDGYAIAKVQPQPAAKDGVPLLTGLAPGGCAITYDLVSADIGVVAIRVAFTTSNDGGVATEAGAMTLVHHVQVSNSP